LKFISKVAFCLVDFENLQRAFDKANKLADKGDPKDWPPQFFIRCLVDIDEFVTEVKNQAIYNMLSFLSERRYKCVLRRR